MALDGGVFSRSIPVSSYTPRLGMLGGASSDVKSKCFEQYEQQLTNRNDNRLKTFGSTYLSDDAPRTATATSLDGSRRRLSQTHKNIISYIETSAFWFYLFNIWFLFLIFWKRLYYILNFSVYFYFYFSITVRCIVMIYNLFNILSVF